MADDLVRVRVGDTETNVGAAWAEARGLTVLDEPTHRYGVPRPATRKNGRPRKPKTTVADQVAAKKEAETDKVSPAQNAEEASA